MKKEQLSVRKKEERGKLKKLTENCFSTLYTHKLQKRFPKSAVFGSGLVLHINICLPRNMLDMMIHYRQLISISFLLIKAG